MQLICDIESEIFRIGLVAYLNKFKQFMLKTTQQKEQFAVVLTVVKQMESYHNKRITSDENEKYLAILRTLHFVLLGSSLQPLVVLRYILPQATKGEWYKCITCRNIYFSPAQYKNNPQCSYCK